MNIRTDFLEAIRQQEESRKPTTASIGEDFANLLAQEVSTSLPGTTLGTRLDPAMLIPTLVGFDQEGSAPDLETMITNQALTLLDSFEGYAKQMAQGSSPKTMYATLVGLEGQLGQMHSSLADIKSTNTPLGNILNELQILTTTEKFKLNRGDFS